MWMACGRQDVEGRKRTGNEHVTHTPSPSPRERGCKSGQALRIYLDFALFFVYIHIRDEDDEKTILIELLFIFVMKMMKGDVDDVRTPGLVESTRDSIYLTLPINESANL